MIDPERLLGGLVRNALGGGGGRRGRRGRRRRMGRQVGGAALGMGALGVAIAAFEHFSQKPGSGADRFSGAAPAPAAGSAAASAGPPPPPPPPAPPQTQTGSVPPPPAPERSDASAADDALLLIRAMIAAANADYEVDADERARILEALDEGALDPDARALLEAELEAPWDIAALAAAAARPDLARQVYLASLLAIDVDTKAEENYLKRLAVALDLDADAVAAIERMVETE